ncbi:MAG TPA: hypothetical protein VFJ94_08930 [Intrasporangium sp.]|uniref:hypothetical protein n=1 Tax=Intrasporangium sp. TaxID=1925024 RepID=UPI002D79DBC0|nr:hypothetical protein [Intrasporangium sp.]HET7398633.1 hypothetical protein [Intrasporangium sp.]
MQRRVPVIPDGVPVLSAGRHRNPRKGACFMEMASFLAGEKWSDHPACTHPLLAAVARTVNDSLGDRARQQLTAMIPEVIGLIPDDERVEPILALRCAQAALAVASAERQNVLAVGILTAERVLAELEGRPVSDLTERSRAALDTVPLAEHWARTFSSRRPTSLASFRKNAAPTMVAVAVEGLGHACVSENETRLVRLLRECIDECVRLSAATRPVTPAASPPAPWTRPESTPDPVQAPPAPRRAWAG